MHFEVEQKFRCGELEGVRRRLVELGASEGEVVEQSDCYYRHPVRDFAQTDEAFRLRRVGERNFITYKGPKVDATTKTRCEEEVRLADGADAAATCVAIFRRLGFEPAATVSKKRSTYHFMQEGVAIEAALDDVAGVGQFVELEASVDAEASESSAVGDAKRALVTAAKALGLDAGATERRSYLELLLVR